MIVMMFKCDNCKKEYGSSELFTDVEMQKRAKQSVGKHIRGLGQVCFGCKENNQDVPEIMQSLWDSSETFYVII